MNTIKRMKLFHFPMSRSARVKWLLHELVGDDFDLEVVPLYDGAQHSSEFLALNANHAVPILQVIPENAEPFTIIESGAIIAWLADGFSDSALAPPPEATRERADYLQILHFCASWFDMMLWQIRVHQDLTPPERRPQRIIDSFVKKVRREVEPQLERRLAQGGYATGSAFSAADCVLGHNVRWARFYDLCGQPVFDHYLDRLAERPAYIAAFADAGDFALVPPALAG
jgi:glutathione S-transferase